MLHAGHAPVAAGAPCLVFPAAERNGVSASAAPALAGRPLLPRLGVGEAAQRLLSESAPPLALRAPRGSLSATAICARSRGERAAEVRPCAWLAVGAHLTRKSSLSCRRALDAMDGTAQRAPGACDASATFALASAPAPRCASAAVGHARRLRCASVAAAEASDASVELDAANAPRAAFSSGGGGGGSGAAARFRC